MDKKGPEYRAGHVSSGIFDCLYDEYFTLLRSRDSFYDFLGYTPQEMEQTFHNHIIECIYPDDRLLVKEKIASQLDKDNVFMFENRLVTKSGDIRWIWISAEPRTDEMQCQYLHCIFHDISDNKKSQEALAISEQRYEIVLSQMQDIIFELDCKTFDIYYSPNFEKKFGYRIPEKGFPDSMFNTDIIYEEDKEPLRNKFKTLLSGETQMYQEYRIKRKDGVYLWVDIHATAMYDSAGKPIKIVGIISDINDRKTEILETQKIATLDPLTGLLNRRECIQRISRYQEESRELAAFILIDIDNFKKLNDTMGHLYGDAALKEIASKLLTVFRKDDIIARIGGDEFVVFLPRIRKRADVLPKLKKIRELFFSTDISPKAPSISSSIGVCFYPEHGTNFTSLFAKADESMYYTKRHGKNNYSFYEGKKRDSLDADQCLKPQLALQKNFHEDILEYLFQIFMKDMNNQTTLPELLDFIGHSFFSDRIYLCRKTVDGDFKVLSTWCNHGVAPMEEGLEELASLDLGLSPEFPIAALQSTKDITVQKNRDWFENRGVTAAFLCWLGNEDAPLHLIGFENCHEIHPEVGEMRYSLFIVSELLNLFLIKNLI